PAIARVPGFLGEPEGDRALQARGRGSGALPVLCRRPDQLGQALGRRIRVRRAWRVRLRVRLPRRQLRDVEHPGRLAASGAAGGRSETWKPVNSTRKNASRLAAELGLVAIRPLRVPSAWRAAAPSPMRSR